MVVDMTMASNIMKASVRRMSSASSPLYEFRVYNVIPSRLKEYLKMTEERFHLRTAHSKLHGFWTVEFGGLNQVAHLWEYNSYQHRASVRAALAGDEKWISNYVSSALSMWDQQTNQTMRLLPGTHFHASGKKGGAYILDRCALRLGVPGDAVSAMHTEASAVTKNAGGDLIATFTTELGPDHGGSVALYRHSNMDEAAKMMSEIRKLRVSEYVGSSSSLGLMPLSISPLQ